MFWDKIIKKKWTIMAATDIGTVRQVNQDNLYVMETPLNCEQLKHFALKKEKKDVVFCAVCDGMGGGANGEEASFMATKMLNELNLDELKNASLDELEKILKHFTQQISDVIYERFKDERRFTGCTITLLYADDKRTLIENVGDSPCILIRGNNYEVISVSDNRANQLYQMGRITEEERWTHKTKNQLTQYLGMNGDEVLLSPHVYTTEEMKKNDSYILFSDGVIDNMGFEEILKTVKEEKSENTAKELIEKALDFGSRDNVTAIIVKREK